MGNHDEDTSTAGYVKGSRDGAIRRAEASVAAVDCCKSHGTLVELGTENARMIKLIYAGQTDQGGAIKKMYERMLKDAGPTDIMVPLPIPGFRHIKWPAKLIALLGCTAIGCAALVVCVAIVKDKVDELNKLLRREQHPAAQVYREDVDERPIGPRVEIAEFDNKSGQGGRGPE